MAAKVYNNLIGGKWVPSRTGKTFLNINPARQDDIVGEFQASGAADVDAAVAAAAEAWKTWRLTPAPKRAEILYRAGQILVDRKEQYAREMTREMGKVLTETRGDVQEAIDTAFYMAGEGRRLFGQTTPSELQNKFAMSVRMPVGVCGMIAPWNFPMAIPSWKLLPALVCGNTCVIKPANDTPLSTINLVQALVDAGVPAGVVNVVTGSGSQVGTRLVEHPGVQAISFTGSSEVGRIVGQTSAGLFKPCSLEMGGKNAMIVLEDANLDLALDGALWGAFGTTGQRCTATSRIIVHRDVLRKFTDELVDRAEELHVGDGLDPGNPDGAAGQPLADRNIDPLLRDREEGRSEDPDGRKAADEGRVCEGTLLRTDGRRQSEAWHAHRAGRSLRPGGQHSGVQELRRRARHRQQYSVRPLDGDLHAGRESRFSSGARSRSWHHLRQRTDDRR